MKTATKLGLMFVGAGVASAYFLGDRAADATENSPLLAAGGEGLVGLGGAYLAWKKKSAPAAIVSGVALGLLVSRVRAGLGAPLGAQSASPPIMFSPMRVVTQQAPPTGFVITQRHPAQPSPFAQLSAATMIEEKPELLR